MPSARRARWAAPPVPGSLKPEGHFLEGQPGPESGHKGFGGREPPLPDDSGLPSPQPLAPFPHWSGTNSPHLWQEAPGHPPRNRQEDANGWRPSPDGANTVPWALVLWGVGGVVRAEEGWGRPQVLTCNVGVKASFLHLLRRQVTWETVKALWGGTPWGGGRRADPQSPSKRKCSHGGGDESLSKGFRGRWIDRHQAGLLSPQPRASEPNPACPTAPPAPACPQTPSPSPEPNAASEWFRAGAGPSLFPGDKVPRWTQCPGEAGEVPDAARTPLPVSQCPFLTLSRVPGIQSNWDSACPGGADTQPNTALRGHSEAGPAGPLEPVIPTEAGSILLSLPVFSTCPEPGAVVLGQAAPLAWVPVAAAAPRPCRGAEPRLAGAGWAHTLSSAQDCLQGIQSFLRAQGNVVSTLIGLGLAFTVALTDTRGPHPQGPGDPQGSPCTGTREEQAWA